MHAANILHAIRISELLCTRLCHDLTGPIGAVNNGAEFLKEEGENIQGQAVDLIVSSAEEAVTRLQFYRRAYGRINEDGEASLTDHKLVCQDFFRGTKISLDWPDMHTDASGLSVSRKLGRVLLNLVIIASHVLIRGGIISVRVSGTENASTHEKEIVLTAEGGSIKWDKDLDAIFDGTMDVSTLTPKTVQPYITLALAQEIGATLAKAVGEQRVVLTLSQRIVPSS